MKILRYHGSLLELLTLQVNSSISFNSIFETFLFVVINILSHSLETSHIFLVIQRKAFLFLKAIE